MSWLRSRLISPAQVDLDLEYSLREIILFKGDHPNNLDQCVRNIKKAFNSKDADRWHNEISKSNKPFDVIRAIAMSKF